jgi:hypothetical protein
MSQRRPTFDSRKDYATFLLAEYKYLIAGVVAAAGILVATGVGELPSIPDPVVAVAGATLLLAVPCYLAGQRIVRWLRTRHFVDVYEVNAADDVIEKYAVPPEVWAEKRVDGPDPWAVDGGDGWAVRQFEWFEETSELAVEGVYFSSLSDDKLFTHKGYVEDIHDELPELRVQLAQLRGRVSDMSASIQQQTLNEAAEARERGTLLESDAARDAWEQAEGDLGDVDELPTIEDVDVDHFADLSPAAQDDLAAGATAARNGEEPGEADE